MTMGADAVVVTGLGATTPLGGDAKATWAAMLRGRSGVATITEPWAAGLPVRIAARAVVDPATVLGRVEARRLDRCTQFSQIAVREAWADAGFVGPAEEDGTPDPDRVAVVIGSSLGGVGGMIGNHEVMRQRGARHVSPYTIPMIMPNGPAGQAGLEIGARAVVSAPTSACATGAEAIACGLDLIRWGRADVVAAGGTDAVIHPLIVAAFAAMGAMSRRNVEPARASRPFDQARDGFVLGEGAAVLILERAGHALARGARMYCQVAGAGLSGDAHHIASPEPDGRGMARAMHKALDDARLRPGQVVHVNAHATSTALGDLAESRALRSVLGTRGYCVSATKSTSGHLLGAAGAIEALATVLALRDRLAPPTINLDSPDPGIEIDVVGNEPRPLPAGPAVALSNSSGFGGHNVVLAFRDFRHDTSSWRCGGRRHG